MRLLWPAVATFRREGWDVGALVAPFGLAEPELDDPDRRLSQDVVTDFWDRAQELSGDPSFGLRCLSSLSSSRRSLVEHILFNTPTLGSMIAGGIRYERLWQQGREASLERRPGEAVLRWTARPGVRFSPPLSELGVAMVVLMARAASGVRLATNWGEVRFLHPAPPDAARYEALFSTPVRFSAPEQAIVFPSDLLDLPLPAADPSLLAILEAYAAATLEKLPPASSVARSVRQVLAQTLADGNASLEETARKLQMSARTLRRRLGDEGSSYQAVLDELRRELALQYLRDPRLSVTEIAFLVGFADTAAFSNAFRRWTGQRPSAVKAGRT
jgi:AraC-like DNA-binding protein